jgi:hypothetical protein
LLAERLGRPIHQRQRGPRHPTTRRRLRAQRRHGGSRRGDAALMPGRTPWSVCASDMNVCEAFPRDWGLCPLMREPGRVLGGARFHGQTETQRASRSTELHRNLEEGFVRALKAHPTESSSVVGVVVPRRACSDRSNCQHECRAGTSKTASACSPVSRPGIRDDVHTGRRSPTWGDTQLPPRMETGDRQAQSFERYRLQHPPGDDARW